MTHAVPLCSPLYNDCFVIYRDSNYNDAILDLWFATQPVKIFYDNGLKSLTKLTIEILTPDGDELRVLYNGTTKLSFTELNIWDCFNDNMLVF